MKFLSLLSAMTLAVTAGAAELSFVRPNVIPEPVKLEFAAEKECRLDNAATVKIVISTEDAAAGEWVREKLRDFLWVSPRIVVSTAAVEGLEGPDDYRLRAEGNVFTLTARGLTGIRNAFYTLRMCLMAERGKLVTKAWICPEITVEDRPLHAFRAMHVCWMPETEVRTIERQIRLAAYFKFNYLLLEFWGTYDSSLYPWFGWEPELRAKRSDLQRLVRLGRDLGVTLIPDLNCFGHASMARWCGGKHAVLDMHPEYQSLFEPREGWVWCLTNPEAKKVLKNLVSELYRDFESPGFFHIGCDESHHATCPVCAATDWPVTVASHIREMRDHIASLGARTLLWQDMLISRKDPRWTDKKFEKYPINGESKEECEKLLALLPKDVVVCDWYYGDPMEEYPTWNYFKELGFDVVPCSWMKREGTLSMGSAAAKEKTFGFMGTTWHHSYNPELYLIYLPSAEAAWGSVDRHDRDGYRDFATRWRQVGWDMGDMNRKDRCGYSHDELPRHTTTPW